jgi:hypothetical protein
MGIYSCILDKNFMCIRDWIFQNILWGIISAATIFIVIKIFVCFRAFGIANKILRKNRGVPGYGHGTRAVDLFIDLWRADIDFNTQYIQSTGNAEAHRTAGEICANYLIPLKLAEEYTAANQQHKLRVIKNFKNRMIHFFVYSRKMRTDKAGV